MGVCEHCNLQHICGSVKRAPMDIEITGELEALIEKKSELAAAKRLYEETDAQIKAMVGDRDKVLTGNYVVTRKAIEKRSYVVPARTEWRLSIKRL